MNAFSYFCLSLKSSQTAACFIFRFRCILFTSNNSASGSIDTFPYKLLSGLSSQYFYDA